jgi:hypothetical protein
MWVKLASIVEATGGGGSSEQGAEIDEELKEHDKEVSCLRN